MSLAHLTLPTRDVEKTARFFEQTLGSRGVRCRGTPAETVWFDIGGGQEMHVFYVEGFEVSPFESEFGRHVAMFYPLEQFTALKARLVEQGATLVEPLRATGFERFFFREPVNGYVFEVIDQNREGR